MAVALTAIASVAAVTMSSSPAYAHTRAEAVDFGCGTGYGIVSDGVRAVKTSAGATWGEVILTYNAGNGNNCVVTRKTVYHGTASRTVAVLKLSSSGTFHSADDNAAHWESVKAHGSGQCAQYWGYVYSPSGSTSALGGRMTWGNCD